MWQLLECEYWRDGGSYSAVLRNAEQTVALWLQVSSWDRPEDRTYKGLYLSSGTDATKQERLLARDEEATWKSVLERDTDVQTASDAHASRLSELIEILRNRTA